MRLLAFGRAFWTFGEKAALIEFLGWLLPRCTGRFATRWRRGLNSRWSKRWNLRPWRSPSGPIAAHFQALQALRASGGAAATVGNSELLDMQCQLAQREGLFVELTAAAPLVALQKLLRRGTIRSGDRVVAIATAGGLKDLDRSAGAKTDDAIRPFASVEDALDHLDDVDAYKSGPLVRITSA
jgi:hypothetical protein